MVVEKSAFPSGDGSSSAKGLTQYTLTSDNLIVKFLNYGCIITNILVKIKTGDVKDIVLGFDDLKGYKSKDNAYFGAVCGRVANRIREGKFSLNGKTYKLNCSAGGTTHLHGGCIGFDQKLFNEVAVGENSVTLSYTSQDGEENYPGFLEVTVKYTLGSDGDLAMDYWARLSPGSEQSTIVNLTNHSYFNLSGCSDEDSSQILDHRMRFEKDCGIIGVLEKDEQYVPTGKIIPLQTGSPFDFYASNVDGKIYCIGDRIKDAADYGYDHGFVFSDDSVKFRENVLRVWSPKTDIMLVVSTTEPNIHLYTGYYLSDTLMSKKTQGDGKVSLGPQSGLCLETQRYPNAVNFEKWKDQVILKPGQEYHQKTVYQIKSL